MKTHLLKICLMFAVFLIALSPGTVAADSKYPERPVTLIQAWRAGGGIDTSLRPLCAAASRILGQPINIEYHTGGSGSVGMGLLKTKKPDGYTIGSAACSTLIHQNLTKIPFDITKDFTPIIRYADGLFGLVVRADSPWKTFKEFIDYAKANPGKIRYSTTGPSSHAYLSMGALTKNLQIEWSNIPFNGGPAALAALLGGHVEAFAAPIAVVKSNILAGRLRLLVVFTEKRIHAFPKVPSLYELGFPHMYRQFYFIVAPRGLSPDTLDTIHQSFKKGMKDPEFIKTVDLVNQIVHYQGPKDLAKTIVKTNEDIKNILRELNLLKSK